MEVFFFWNVGGEKLPLFVFLFEIVWTFFVRLGLLLFKIVIEKNVFFCLIAFNETFVASMFNFLTHFGKQSWQSRIEFFIDLNGFYFAIYDIQKIFEAGFIL